MRPPPRPCLGPPGGARCPHLTHDTSGRCDTCRRATDRRRGTTAERGYGGKHRALRAQWAPRVAAGTVRCVRCGEFIAPGESWDLGHSELDRGTWSGPEHSDGNRGRRRCAARPSAESSGHPGESPSRVSSGPRIVDTI
jgi:hypothetical protein